MTTISQRIKIIRKKLDLKQSYIAHKMGVTQQFYHAIESGKKGRTYNVIMKVAEVFEVDPLFILTEEIPITDKTVDLFKRKTVSEIVIKHFENISLKSNNASSIV